MADYGTSKMLVRPHLRRLAIWTVLVLMLASSLVVLPDEAEAQGPGMKDITFYFHNVTSGAVVGSITTMRIMNTTQGDTLNVSARSAKAIQYDFYLYPVLADNTTIENNVTVHIWARRIATSGDNRGAAMLFRLYDVDSSGTTVATVAQTTYNENNMMTAWTEYHISATGVSSYTVDAGHTLRLYVEIDGSSSNDYQMAWGDTTRKSRVEIEMSDYVRVNDVKTLDYQRTPKVIFSQLTANKTMIFKANITDPYGGYDVAMVNATLVAPNGTTILDSVPMTKTQGYFNTYHNEYERTWNYSGFPTGQYNLTVTTVDWTGYYYRYPTNPGDAMFGGHLESMAVSFWIGGMPHDVIINVTDDLDHALKGAMVVMGEATGTTDTAGSVVLRLANGTYDLEVLWQGVSVYLASHSVSNDTWIDVKAAVYSPRLIALDDVGDPVFDAVVFTTHPNGTVLSQSWRTDATGSVQWDTMAGGDYSISVLWMGVEVYNSTVTIDSQGPFQLDLMVYQLDIQVVDSAGDGLELAQVVIVNTTNGLVADSKLTNFTGHTVSKVPIGSYDFKVYWRNELVFDDLYDHLVDASGTLMLQARIYAVNLTVVDASDVPLANARVVVGFAISGHVQDFGTTNATGTLSTRLPVGYYNFWVYWKDVLVNETVDFYFDGVAEHTIHASVYWVVLTIQDTENVTVASALVSLRHSDGLDFGTVSTDDDGNVSYRLPGGDYRVVVAWKETVVFDQVRLIGSQEPIVLTVAIHYLRLHVVDSRKAPVESALVTTHNDTSGAIVGSSVTDASGNTTHRLPVGTYRVHIVWQEAVVYEQMHLVASNEPVTLVVAIHYVDIHVKDTLNVSLEGAMITFTNVSTGRSMGSQGTSEDGNVSYRVPIGDYNVTVVWQEALVHESDERVDMDRTLEITATVYYAFIEVVDTTDVPLAGASVTLTNPDTGRIMGSLVTDDEGKATFRLPLHNYSILVVWQESVVFDSIMPVDGNYPMVLVASVYYAELHITDTTAVPLESALVTFTNTSTGRQMGEHTTASDGIVIFRLPMGPYTVVITWQETVVWTADRYLDSNEPWNVVASVYYAELHIVDSKDAPVEAALVSLTNESSERPMGDRTTGDNGIVVYRIPLGTYSVQVLWADTVVYHQDIRVDTNDPFTLVVDIYYPTFDVADSREIALTGALVTMTKEASGRIIGSQLTDAEGLTTFRVPLDTYDVSIVWLDTLVHRASYDVDSNDVHAVSAWVYYVDTTAVDSRDVGLEFPQIALSNSTTGRIMASHTADVAGTTQFRLPVGEYAIAVQWQHARVLEETRMLDGDAEWTLKAWVYYVTFHVTDGAGIDLAGASVSLTNETASVAMGPVNTDAFGNAEFRLPLGDVSILVTWRTVVVHEADRVVIDADAVKEVSAKVNYLTVLVTDSKGIKLKAATIEVDRDGEVVASVQTDGRGEAFFRLPHGHYFVNMSFSTTYYLTPIDVDRSEEIDLQNATTVEFDLTSKEYPIPFYKTNLFWIVLVIVLLVLGLLYLIYRARTAPEEEVEEPIEYGDGDLDDLLEDLDTDGEEKALTGAAALGVEEYSEEDLEDTEEEPAEYSEEDLEDTGEAPGEEETSEEADEEEAIEGSEDEEERDAE